MKTRIILYLRGLKLWHLAQWCARLLKRSSSVQCYCRRRCFKASFYYRRNKAEEVEHGGNGCELSNDVMVLHSRSNKIIHPSIHCLPELTSTKVCWSLSQQSHDQGRVTSTTSHQFISGSHTVKQLLALTHTPM